MNFESFLTYIKNVLTYWQTNEEWKYFLVFAVGKYKYRIMTQKQLKSYFSIFSVSLHIFFILNYWNVYFEYVKHNKWQTKKEKVIEKRNNKKR